MSTRYIDVCDWCGEEGKGRQECLPEGWAELFIRDNNHRNYETKMLCSSCMTRLNAAKAESESILSKRQT